MEQQTTLPIKDSIGLIMTDAAIGLVVYAAARLFGADMRWACISGAAVGLAAQGIYARIKVRHLGLD